MEEEEKVRKEERGTYEQTKCRTQTQRVLSIKKGQGGYAPTLTPTSACREVTQPVGWPPLRIAPGSRNRHELLPQGSGGPRFSV